MHFRCHIPPFAVLISQPKKPALGAQSRRRAELELLLLDDARLRAGALPKPHVGLNSAEGSTGRGQELTRKQRVMVCSPPAARLCRCVLRPLIFVRILQAAKQAKQAAKQAAAVGELNVKDNRFAALYTRPEYALDPTDPRYKMAGGVEAIKQETRKRRVDGTAPLDQSYKAEAGDSIIAAVASLKQKGKNTSALTTNL